MIGARPLAGLLAFFEEAFVDDDATETEAMLSPEQITQADAAAKAQVDRTRITCCELLFAIWRPQLLTGFWPATACLAGETARHVRSRPTTRWL